MSCWVISGLVLLATAFIASAVSLVAPYWLHAPPSEQYGLWAHCVSDHKCTWFFEDNFAWEKERTVWWQCSQGLFGGGVLFLLIAFLVACINLCSGCCKCAQSMLHFINGLLTFSFLCLAVSLTLFGVKANSEMGVVWEREPGNKYYDWGYWVGCGAAVLDLLAILMYTCAGCKSDHDGYTRGEVV